MEQFIVVIVIGIFFYYLGSRDGKKDQYKKDKAMMGVMEYATIKAFRQTREKCLLNEILIAKIALLEKNKKEIDEVSGKSSINTGKTNAE
jgi:hypothetical protein